MNVDIFSDFFNLPEYRVFILAIFLAISDPKSNYLNRFYDKIISFNFSRHNMAV